MNITKNSLISVIMSVFNGEGYLRRSIESILSQTYKNIEFLILDDFSTDNSLKIIKEYSLIDNRVKVYSNSINLGLTKSLNRLIKYSNGHFIARQDADDYSFKDRLEKQIIAMHEYNLDVVGSRALKKNNSLIPKYSFYLPHKITIKYKNPFIHGTLMFKKDLLSEINNYDERFYYAQDYKLMKDLIIKGKKIKIIKEPLYFINFENNISINFKEEQRYYFNCAKKNLIPKEYI